MRVYITVREHEFHEDGYIVDKREELYLNEGRKDGYQYARIYHRTL